MTHGVLLRFGHRARGGRNCFVVSSFHRQRGFVRGERSDVRDERDDLRA